MVTVHVEVKQGAVLVLTGRSVEKVDEARIPALIRLVDAGQVERRQAVVRRRRDARNATLVAVARVKVVFVPDKDWNLDALHNQCYLALE